MKEEEKWNPKAETWCEYTIRTIKEKKRSGEALTEDDCIAYAYAKNVIDSEEAERAYLNGEDY